MQSAIPIHDQEIPVMLKDGFLICPECGKKIMRITPTTTFNGVAYCYKCKTSFDVVIARDTVYKMKTVEKE